MTQSAHSAWYRDGLRFTCTQCGDCCTGAPGFVWVDDAEIAALAARCGESVERFTAAYVRRVGKRRSLKELAGGDCVFFRKGVGCVVYEDRPAQCRTWPFWDSNLESPETWQATCEECPGAGRGAFVPLEEIERQAAVVAV